MGLVWRNGVEWLWNGLPWVCQIQFLESWAKWRCQVTNDSRSRDARSDAPHSVVECEYTCDQDFVDKLQEKFFKNDTNFRLCITVALWTT